MQRALYILFIAALIFFCVASITTAATISFPATGGTGTGVAPTQGQVLVGQSNGTYAPQATSTLGITGGGGGGPTTLTGDVTGSGTGTISTAIGALKVLGTMIANGAVDLTTKVTGILPVGNGGTGTSTITGLLKGNGTSPFTVAAAGTDYQAPVSLTTTGTSGAATFAGNTLNIPQYAGTTYTAGTGLTLSSNAFSVNTSQNISTLSNLTGNGLLKTTGGTGTLSMAVAGTDYQTPISLTTSGTSGAATFASGVLNIPQYSGGGGGGTNYFTNSGSNTYLNTGTRLQSLAFDATSTTATSTISNSLTIGSNVKFPLLQIGSTTPSYGYLPNDRLNIIDSVNDYSADNSYNLNAGACATADKTEANDLNSTALNFFDMGHTSSGFTGVGCTNNPFTGFGANSSYLFDPSGDINIDAVAGNLKFFTGGYSTSNIKAELLQNGNFGIGTTTPGDQLSVKGSGGNVFATYSNAGAQTTYINDNGDLYVKNGAIQANAQILFNSSVYTQFQANSPNVNLNFKTVAGSGAIVLTPNATDALSVQNTKAELFGGHSLQIDGSTSGSVTVQVPAAAGSTTFQLPSSNGSNGQFLQTNGSGVTSWATVSGSGTVTSVSTDSTLTGGPITTSGTLGLNLANSNIWTAAQVVSVASTSALTVSASSGNTALRVDTSTASLASGISIKGDVTGGTPTLTAIDSGSNTNLDIEAKGTGLLTVGGTSTGGVTVGNASAASTILAASNSVGVRGIIAGSSTFGINRSQTYFSNNFSLATAATVRFSWLGAADGSLTASTEAPDVYFNMGQTRSHATGSLTTQRDFRITGSTHAAVAASTITNVAAFSIDGPDAAGSNATITNSSAIYVPTIALAGGGTVTNAYDLWAAAPSGATNNYVASTTGRWIMNGLTTSATGNALCLSTTGEVLNAGSGTCTPSTVHAKHDIQDIGPDDIAKLMQLRPVTYIRNDTGEARYGLIAEEVAQIDPKLVVLAKQDTSVVGQDGKPFVIHTGQPLTVDYQTFTGLLLAGYQQLAAAKELAAKPVRSVEDNYQWAAILILAAWIIRLERKLWTIKK